MTGNQSLMTWEPAAPAITTVDEAIAYLGGRTARPNLHRVWVAQVNGKGLHYRTCWTFGVGGHREPRIATPTDVLRVNGHPCSFCKPTAAPWRVSWLGSD